MKKKIIGLSILSLVLLLGLSTNCYAWQYDVTTTDMQKVAQWLYPNNTSFRNKAVTLYNTLSYHGCDTYIIWTYRYNGSYSINMATLNKSQITSVNNPHNANFMGITFTGDCYWGTASSSENNHYYTKTNGSNWGNGSGGQYRSPYLFFSNDLTDDVANNPNLEGPYENVEVLGAFEEPIRFVPDSNTTANVENLSQTFYLISKEAVTSKFLGTLYKSRLIEGIYSDFYIYNTYQKSWQYVNDLVVYNGGVGHIDEYFNTDISQGDWVSEIYIKNRLLSPNTYFRYQFIPKNADFDDYIDVWFYVYDTNTKFNNGSVSPALTFSGDYIDQYRDETNQLIDDIDDTETNDNIKDVQDTLVDDSEVDNILSDNFSGDSLLSNIGYSPIENPFTTIILNTLQNFTDALLDSGNETLSFQVYDSTISINSDDFKLPDGLLKTFITLMCNAFVIYEVCKYGFTLYEWINSGRLQNLVNESNNHQYYLF